jgi:hypothetical protein
MCHDPKLQLTAATAAGEPARTVLSKKDSTVMSPLAALAFHACCKKVCVVVVVRCVGIHTPHNNHYRLQKIKVVGLFSQIDKSVFTPESRTSTRDPLAHSFLIQPAVCCMQKFAGGQL